MAALIPLGIEAAGGLVSEAIAFAAANPGTTIAAGTAGAFLLNAFNGDENKANAALATAGVDANAPPQDWLDRVDAKAYGLVPDFLKSAARAVGIGGAPTATGLEHLTAVQDAVRDAANALGISRYNVIQLTRAMRVLATASEQELQNIESQLL